MDNFRKVSNCNKSKGLDFFLIITLYNRDIKWKLALKNITCEIEFRYSIQD